MKKKIIVTALAMVLLIVQVTGSLATGGDDWAYPEDVLAYMFRLGIACEATGIQIPYDPYALTDGGDGYFSMLVGSTQLTGMYDLQTMRLSALAFPVNNAAYEEQDIILAAFCEDVSVTTSNRMTGELFLQLGEIAMSQVVGEMTESGAPVSLGAYTFGAFTDDNGILNITIRAN